MFKAGRFNFEMKPIDGYYFMDVSNYNGETLEQYPIIDSNGLPVSVLRQEEVSEIVKDPRLIIEEYFVRYLGDYADHLVLNR
jgi:hypothetical protein